MTVGQGDIFDKVFHFGAEAARVVLASALWLVFSLPLVTLPAATVGAYALIVAHLADGDKQYAKPFFTGFRRSFATATLPGLLMIVLVVLTGFNAWYYAATGRAGHLSWLLAVVQALLCAGVAGLASGYFALVARRVTTDEPPSAKVVVKDVLVTWGPHPRLCCGVVGVVVGVPTLFVWLGFWQFMVFAVGIIVYAVSWLLVRVERSR